MYLVTLISMLALATCARLEPQYLPPRTGSYAVAGSSAYSGASSSSVSGAVSGAFSGASSYSGVGSGANIPILKYENVNNGDGNYRYSYETGNGISVRESGSPRVPGPEGPAVAAEGAFSYRAPDGQQVALTYTADENGFRPQGAHLPTPPPIPEAILRSIEFNRRNPSSEGAYNPGGYQY